MPPDTRVYAISDIHGRADLLQQMFRVIDADLARLGRVRALHIFLGDYVDRGPDSCATLDLLIERGRKHESIFLKGNHEAIMASALRDPTAFPAWAQYGGLQTLQSYGLKPSTKPDDAERSELMSAFAQKLPAQHRGFLRNLKLTYTCGDFFFVHAGVRPGIALPDQKEEDLIWIRNEFLDSDENFGKFIVHGHTPVSAPDVRAHRINIDTGAYATGNLTLLTIAGHSILAL